ncbi:MAG: DUF4040 domain-containing protein, partial [Alphaproteobacteria bacterium]|nr:DUF4040 domain-containing protein [Alphaproteobacteria bacterium]
MAATIVLIVRIHNLFAVVMLGGLYSLMAASMFVLLDAVDVAFTEAAVGAGISTVLMLGALALTKSDEKVKQRRNVLPLLLVIATGAALIYGTLD